MVCKHPNINVLFAIALPDKIFPMIFGLHHINTDLCWFALGAWFFKHEQDLLPKASIPKIGLIILGFIAFIVAQTLYPQEYGSKTIVGIIVTIMILYSLWILYSWIPWKNLIVTNFLMTLSACSFGIYIFHNWIEAHMISRTAQHFLPLEHWAQTHVYLFPFLFSTVAFVISLGLTWTLLQTNIGKKLIG